MKAIRWDPEAMEALRRRLSRTLGDMDIALRQARSCLRGLQALRDLEDSPTLRTVAATLSLQIGRTAAEKADAEALDGILKRITEIFEETEAQGKFPEQMETDLWEENQAKHLTISGPGGASANVAYTLIREGDSFVFSADAVAAAPAGEELRNALEQGGAHTKWWDASPQAQSTMGIEKVGVRAGVMDAVLPGEFIHYP